MKQLFIILLFLILAYYGKDQPGSLYK